MSQSHCPLCAGPAHFRPHATKTFGCYRLNCVACDLDGLLSVQPDELTGLDNVRRFQRMLHDPDARGAYLHLLSLYEHPSDPEVEALLPHQHLLSKLPQNASSKHAKLDTSSERGYCPWCTSFSVLRPYKSKRASGFSLFCATCYWRMFLTVPPRHPVGLENLRRHQRLLLDPPARNALVDALLGYDEPVDPRVEALLPSLAHLEQRREQAARLAASTPARRKR